MGTELVVDLYLKPCPIANPLFLTLYLMAVWFFVVVTLYLTQLYAHMHTRYPTLGPVLQSRG